MLCMEYYRIFNLFGSGGKKEKAALSRRPKTFYQRKSWVCWADSASLVFLMSSYQSGFSV